MSQYRTNFDYSVSSELSGTRRVHGRRVLPISSSFMAPVDSICARSYVFVVSVAGDALDRLSLDAYIHGFEGGEGCFNVQQQCNRSPWVELTATTQRLRQTYMKVSGSRLPRSSRMAIDHLEPLVQSLVCSAGSYHSPSHQPL